MSFIKTIDTWRGKQHLIRTTSDSDWFIQFLPEHFEGLHYSQQYIGVLKVEGKCRQFEIINRNVGDWTNAERELLALHLERWERKVSQWEHM